MNKTIVVTGGGRGLGLEITRELLEQDYNVIVVSRSFSEELKQFSKEHTAFVAHDFGDLAGIHALSRKLISVASDQFGGGIYGLVNNSAVGNDGVLGTMHESDIATTLCINVHAPILLTKYVSRHMMLKLIPGRIINIGSIIADTGYSGLSVYAASKSALEGFSRSLARELGGRGITVNVVAPGFMATDMTSTLEESKLERIRRRSALGRFASASAVAGSVCYLLSSPAADITGTVLTVDAGSTA